MLPLSEIKPGQTLGRYELLMPIAEGGMAAVWAARLVGTRGFQKVVAIKTMLPELSDDLDFEAMFLDEARLASRIKHPHVAEIVDLGEEDDLLYLVMEWVSGETMFQLNKLAKAKGGIPIPILVRLASDACAGLHAAHELRDANGKLEDLVHRDISPQNIMISEGGIVKIVDFGVAKAAGRAYETRVTGLIKGKVPYLSPEQLSGAKVDRRSDIFSIGILMYVMVTGRHPFRGDNDARTMENICSRAPVPLCNLVPDTRPDLEAVVMKALAKDAGDRWSDCAEMQRALNQVMSAIGTSVTDGDVAQFVRDTMGHLFEERNRKLAEAIKRADSRLASEPPRKVSRAVRGGAPLPATFQGILPVALEDGSGRDPSAPPPPLPPLPAVTTSRPLAMLASQRPRKRRLSGVYILLLLIMVLGVGALLIKTGSLPWLVQRLPPWLSVLAPASN